MNNEQFVVRRGAWGEIVHIICWRKLSDSGYRDACVRLRSRSSLDFMRPNTRKVPGEKEREKEREKWFFTYVLSCLVVFPFLLQNSSMFFLTVFILMDGGYISYKSLEYSNKQNNKTTKQDFLALLQVYCSIWLFF